MAGSDSGTRDQAEAAAEGPSAAPAADGGAYVAFVEELLSIEQQWQEQLELAMSSGGGSTDDIARTADGTLEALYLQSLLRPAGAADQQHGQGGDYFMADAGSQDSFGAQLYDSLDPAMSDPVAALQHKRKDIQWAVAVLVTLMACEVELMPNVLRYSSDLKRQEKDLTAFFTSAIAAARLKASTAAANPPPVCTVDPCSTTGGSLNSSVPAAASGAAPAPQHMTLQRFFQVLTWYLREAQETMVAVTEMGLAKFMLVSFCFTGTIAKMILTGVLCWLVLCGELLSRTRQENRLFLSLSRISRAMLPGSGEIGICMLAT